MYYKLHASTLQNSSSFADSNDHDPVHLKSNLNLDVYKRNFTDNLNWIYYIAIINLGEGIS